MRITQVLQQQRLGWYFNKFWNEIRKRPILPTQTEQILKEKGIKIIHAEDLLRPKPEHLSINIVGDRIPTFALDSSHPKWHDRPLLTYRDDNVLLEGLNQAKSLTKTVEPQSGLPKKLEITKVSKEIDDLCKNIVLNCHVFDAEQEKLPIVKDPARPAWNFPRTYGITQNRVNKLIISKLLQLIESRSSFNLVQERFIFRDLLFSYPFERNGDLIQFQLKGDTVLTSNKPLKPITDESTESLELPSIFPINHTITLNKENIYDIKNIFPIKKGITKSHPHTIIIHFNKETVNNLYEEEVTENQIHGRSLLKTFTAAATYAHQLYGDTVGDLPKPIVLQCIQTNGKFFHFGILQLNTLDLDAGAIKNVWYQTEMIQLFEKCCYENGKAILEGYNSDVIRNLFAFYNNV